MDNPVRRTTNRTAPHQKLTLKETYLFFKNDLKEPEEINLLGKTTLHTVFHSFIIQTNVKLEK